MNEINALKKQIFLYGILVAVLCEIISLFILGLNMKFSYGLALGTCIAIVNFNLLIFTWNKVLTSGSKWLAVIGYFIRMALYGYCFFICVKIGYMVGFACLIGFFTLKLPMYWLYGIKYKYNRNRKVRPEVQAIYDEEDRIAEDKYYGREEED